MSIKRGTPLKLEKIIADQTAPKAVLNTDLLKTYILTLRIPVPNAILVFNNKET